MNMRVVDGAAFDRGTALPHPSSIWVSESLARRLFPGEFAVGKPVDRLDTDGTPVVMREPVPPFTIAGVVADAAELSLRELSAELVYVPTVEPSVEKSIVPTSLSYVIRTELAPSRIAAAVKQALADQNQDLSFGGIRTMAAIVSSARATETFLSVLLVAGAAVAVLLGAAGIYGSVAETVRGRTREVGIRRALGARPASLVLLVSSAVVRATLAGVGVGILVAIGASRALATLVYGVTATDPLVLTAASGLLLAAAAAASLLGAFRVVRISPLRALRRE
jgi:ABC-type antimicrobial peptide transport system permease subunit